MSTSVLTEAANIAQTSVVGVDPVPSITVGIAVFVIILLIYIMYVNPYLVDNASRIKYNSDGCAIDIKGNPITKPIYSDNSRKHIIGQNNCVTKSPEFINHIFGLTAAIIGGAVVGASIYKAQFYISNPKLATGLYATDMLLGRR